MIILGIIITILIVIFESMLREIHLFAHISLFFVMVNMLFWFKRYKLVFIVGIIGGILIDLMIKNRLGESSFSLFAPLLFLSFIEGILKIDSKMGRIIFSVIGVNLSIFISDFLFALLFWEGNFVGQAIISRMLVSTVVLLFSTLLFYRVLSLEDENVHFLRK